ncbi:hypothetical protein PMPD1_2558 [Paramixta manurensis]|uniref:YD repeat-containing protein n=1 Tax=Paramixta manurensis TaxID=2740817 RepID=A0A6M8UIC4_9GAMM|nr:hypothetical protein PMPD1_2558 [Erwiniaceae bacterium PD-1]
MNMTQWFYPLLLSVVLPFTFQARAATPCAGVSQAVNDSNSVIMLGGTAKGPIKQFVLGEFGKDVNLQKRMLGQFDRCGVLSVADISYDKSEGGVTLSMAQHLTRVQGGWLAEYQISVKVQRGDQQVEVNNKQGTINYSSGKRGNITSASDSFVLMGKKGFTETTYRYNRHLRLTSSVARGSDALTNGEYHYRWNAKGQVLSTTSNNSKEHYTYDKHHRELRMDSVSHLPSSTLTAVDECQSWDDTGNCTLSYSREMEVSDKNTLQRNISAAYRFEYWDKETSASAK